MKKLFMLLATLILSTSVQAAQFNEGTHYEVLDLEKTSTPTVTEYFSFFCGHCNNFEPVIQQLKTKLPKNAKFQKVHVSFMGGNMGVPMAKAYASMIVLKVEDKMVPYMFNQIHTLRTPPKTETELRQMFIDNGVDAKKFDSAYKGFAIDSMQKRFDKQFKAVKLSGVPGVVVNNRYVVKTDGIKNYDEYFDLVNYLLAL
ncbi:thiol:disulfide interchange protein DsbA/DsbL [Vibrio sp. F74]|uniref:thiol:disulfide interchange protein DsbA/DsbL n=1 Tax=Vibrio sp. F74 TaxID=700020 RepID=UPI0035F5C6E2